MYKYNAIACSETMQFTSESVLGVLFCTVLLRYADGKKHSLHNLLYSHP